MIKSKGGAPKGNQNAKRAGEWRNAIKDVLKHYESDKVQRGRALYCIARKVTELALEGDMTAVREIGDRLDGKPAQALELSGDVNSHNLVTLSDDELIAIIRTSSARAADPETSPAEPDELH